MCPKKKNKSATADNGSPGQQSFPKDQQGVLYM